MIDLNRVALLQFKLILGILLTITGCTFFIYVLVLLERNHNALQMIEFEDDDIGNDTKLEIEVNNNDNDNNTNNDNDNGYKEVDGQPISQHSTAATTSTATQGDNNPSMKIIDITKPSAVVTTMISKHQRTIQTYRRLLPSQRFIIAIQIIVLTFFNYILLVYIPGSGFLSFVAISILWIITLQKNINNEIRRNIRYDRILWLITFFLWIAAGLTLITYSILLLQEGYVYAGPARIIGYETSQYNNSQTNQTFLKANVQVAWGGNWGCNNKNQFCTAYLNGTLCETPYNVSLLQQKFQKDIEYDEEIEEEYNEDYEEEIADEDEYDEEYNEQEKVLNSGFVQDIDYNEGDEIDSEIDTNTEDVLVVTDTKTGKVKDVDVVFVDTNEQVQIETTTTNNNNNNTLSNNIQNGTTSDIQINYEYNYSQINSSTLLGSDTDNNNNNTTSNTTTTTKAKSSSPSKTSSSSSSTTTHDNTTTTTTSSNHGTHDNTTNTVHTSGGNHSTSNITNNNDTTAAASNNDNTTNTPEKSGHHNNNNNNNNRERKVLTQQEEEDEEEIEEDEVAEEVDEADEELIQDEADTDVSYYNEAIDEVAEVAEITEDTEIQEEATVEELQAKHDELLKEQDKLQKIQDELKHKLDNENVEDSEVTDEINAAEEGVFYDDDYYSDEYWLEYDWDSIWGEYSCADLFNTEIYGEKFNPNTPPITSTSTTKKNTKKGSTTSNSTTTKARDHWPTINIYGSCNTCSAYIMDYYSTEHFTTIVNYQHQAVGYLIVSAITACVAIMMYYIHLRNPKHDNTMELLSERSNHPTRHRGHHIGVIA